MKMGKLEICVQYPHNYFGFWQELLSTMEVGDSFVVYPEGDEDMHLIANRISAIKRKYEKKLEKKFISRRTIRLKPGMRVWRVK